MTAPALAVVLPTYRNAAALAALHERLRAVVDRADIPTELIFVNDASPDETLSVLRRLAESDPGVRVIDLPVNQGQQRATMAGLRETSTPLIAVMDADLQDPPEALPMLICTLSEGRYEAVFAGRAGRYESRGRLLTSRAFKLLVHRLTGVPRDAGSYVVMTRELVDRLLAFDADDPYLVGMIGCSRLPVTSVPVERLPRADGASAYTPAMRLSVGVRALRQIATTWRTT